MPLIKGKSQKSFVKNLKTEMEHGKPQKQSLAIAYSMKRKAEHRKKMADGGSSYGSSMAATAANSGNTAGNQPGAASKFASAFKAHGGEMEGNDKLKEAYRKGYADGGQVKGVHQSYGITDSSSSGLKVKHANFLNNKKGSPADEGKWSAQAEGLIESAKKDHKQVLDENRRINPNIKGMAHGGFLEDEEASGYLDMPMEHESYNSMAMHEDDKDLNQHHVNMHAETSPHEEDLVDRIMMQRSNKYSEGGKVANQEHGENNNSLAGFDPNEFDDLVLRDDLESSYGDDDNAGDDLGNEQEDEDRNDIVARIMASRKKKDRNPNPA